MKTDPRHNLKDEKSIETILRNFELDLLGVLGYEINFSTEYGTNNDLEPEQKYKYSPQSGFSKSSDGFDGKILKFILFGTKKGKKIREIKIF